MPLDAFANHVTVRYARCLWHFVGPSGKGSRAARGNLSSKSFSGMTETPPLRLARSIVMVGLMGAGKTSIGRRLAQKLHVPFID